MAGLCCSCEAATQDPCGPLREGWKLRTVTLCSTMPDMLNDDTWEYILNFLHGFEVCTRFACQIGALAVRRRLEWLKPVACSGTLSQLKEYSRDSVTRNSKLNMKVRVLIAHLLRSRRWMRIGKRLVRSGDRLNVSCFAANCWRQCDARP